MSALAIVDVPRRLFAPYLVKGTSPRVSNLAFATVVGGIGVLSLVLSLFINVALTQGAFEEASLTREVKAIEAAQQSAHQTLAMLASPGEIESRARAMGMVPAASPVFLRLADAKVFGRPEAADAQIAPDAVNALMPDSSNTRPILQMAAAAVQVAVVQPTSDAAVELPLEPAP